MITRFNDMSPVTSWSNRMQYECGQRRDSVESLACYMYIICILRATFVPYVYYIMVWFYDMNLVTSNINRMNHEACYMLKGMWTETSRTLLHHVHTHTHKHTHKYEYAVFCWESCVLHVYHMYIACYMCREVGGWGRVPFSRNLMSPTPRRKWYLTTGRRAH